MVSVFCTLPGSNTSVAGRLRQRSWSPSTRSFGSNSGALAIASTSPVPTSSTVTLAPAALNSAIAASTAALRGVLDLAVDGQDQIGTDRRRDELAHPGGDVEAAGGALDREHAGLPAQDRVEVTLEALQPGAVDVGEPDHLAGELTCRVDPLRLGQHADPGQLELGDRDPHLVVELAGEVGEVALRCRRASIVLARRPSSGASSAATLAASGTSSRSPSGVGSPRKTRGSA
jgi:hypothetical protein